MALFRKQKPIAVDEWPTPPICAVGLILFGERTVLENMGHYGLTILFTLLSKKSGHSSFNLSEPIGNNLKNVIMIRKSRCFACNS